MTKTQTTFYRTRMLAGHPIDPRGPNCETIELARHTAIAGPETAIVKTDWRLGGDGAWHETTSVIVEIKTISGETIHASDGGNV